jgi:hypothetical protein
MLVGWLLVGWLLVGGLLVPSNLTRRWLAPLHSQTKIRVAYRQPFFLSFVLVFR